MFAAGSALDSNKQELRRLSARWYKVGGPFGTTPRTPCVPWPLPNCSAQSPAVSTSGTVVIDYRLRGTELLYLFYFKVVKAITIFDIILNSGNNSCHKFFIRDTIWINFIP